MIDLFHIPNSQEDIKIFYADAGSTSYQTWQKPRNCSFIYIISIDGGGGGASGNNAVLNVNTINNFGGGTGSINRALINSNLIPNTLYIKVGKGGIGGVGVSTPTTGFNAGNAGESSGVFLASQLDSQNTSARTVSFFGGLGSTNGGTNVSGAGTPASSLSNNYLIGLTNFISTQGTNSQTGGISTAVPDVNIFGNSFLLHSGSGGGPYNGTATAFNGGSLISTSSITSLTPSIIGGVGGSTTGGNGADGITSWKPFFSVGGAGGGNAYTSGGVAGNGGKGGIGSGGGAGGNANNGTSGKGGDGGDGIVMIIAF